MKSYTVGEMSIAVNGDMSLNHGCQITDYGRSEFLIFHLTKESFSHNYLTPYAWHIHMYTHTCICVYIFIYILLRLANIHKQINLEENAQSRTCPDKRIPKLNLEFCLDNISPCVYPPKWIFISL